MVGRSADGARLCLLELAGELASHGVELGLQAVLVDVAQVLGQGPLGAQRRLGLGLLVLCRVERPAHPEPC